MKINSFEDFSFITGAIRYKDLCYAVALDNELVKKDTTHSQLLYWDKGQWSSAGVVGWSTHAMAIADKPLSQMVVVGEGGQVVVNGSHETHTEQIKDGDVSPEGRGPIRRAANIGGLVYACGMDYQVYKRADANKWECIDASIPKKKEVRGFEHIAGRSENDIYAVGWEGEVWHYDGKKWEQEKSPTELILTGVTIADDDTVYACGQMGVLLKREKGEWKMIGGKDNPKNDLWDIKWFQGKLYVSSMQQLFVYNAEKDALEPVDFGKVQPTSFYHLSTADGAMLSVGAKDILKFDGKEWESLI